MAPRTTPATDDTTSVEPVDLYELVRTGAVFAGDVVIELTITTASGMTHQLQLRAAGGPVAAGKRWAETKPGRAILATLAAEGRPLKGETVAKLADYPYSGSFREALRGLEQQGEIVRTADGYELG